MHVIGVGVGRTGTYSLKLALNRLGLGPCHHMESVMQNLPVQVPLWSAAVAGQPDWPAIYAGCGSAVDFPTAAFYRELCAAYPDACFVLTERSPQSWAESYSQTIAQVIAGRADAPPPVRDWLAMVSSVLQKAGIPDTATDLPALERAFVAHNTAVRAAIPPARLLVFEAQQGWDPLCAFLNQPVPDEPFPRSNNREEFWELVRGGTH